MIKYKSHRVCIFLNTVEFALQQEQIIKILLTGAARWWGSFEPDLFVSISTWWRSSSFSFSNLATASLQLQIKPSLVVFPKFNHQPNVNDVRKSPEYFRTTSIFNRVVLQLT